MTSQLRPSPSLAVPAPPGGESYLPPDDGASTRARLRRDARAAAHRALQYPHYAFKLIYDEKRTIAVKHNAVNRRVDETAAPNAPASHL